MSDEILKKVQSSTDDELGRMIVVSAKQLAYGAETRRALHRYIVDLALSELAKRGLINEQ